MHLDIEGELELMNDNIIERALCSLRPVFKVVFFGCVMSSPINQKPSKQMRSTCNLWLLMSLPSHFREKADGMACVLSLIRVSVAKIYIT